MREDLSLHFKYPKGQGSIEVGLDSALAAPIRVSLETGRPPGAWRYLVVYDSEGEPPRVVGAMAHTPTPGDRFLFFPAAPLEVSAQQRGTRFSEPTLMDHLTLDPPRKAGAHKSHVAAGPPSGARGLTRTTKPPPGTLVPWFSLLVPDLDPFPRLPGEMIVRFDAPHAEEKGFQQFADRLVRAGGGTVVLPLPPAAAGSSFVQLDMWAGRGEGWRGMASRVLPWVYKTELVRAAPPGRQTVRATSIDFEVADGRGLRPILSRPEGVLLGARILRPQLSADLFSNDR